MVKAFVFLTVQPGRVRDIVNATRDIPGVQRVFAVTGPYDVIVEVRGETIEEIGRKVVESIQNIPGVERTLTSIVVEI